MSLPECYAMTFSQIDQAFERAVAWSKQMKKLERRA
jgi:hypothetical protein